MCVDITYTNMWTYSNKFPPNKKHASERQLSIEHLDTTECTHIHGDLRIEIDGRNLPSMGFNMPSGICFGYWITALTSLLNALKQGASEYTIHGMDQGLPGFLFRRKEYSVYMSIVPSFNEGKADPEWQNIEIRIRDLKMAYKKFKEIFLAEVAQKASHMLEKWSAKF